MCWKVISFIFPVIYVSICDFYDVDRQYAEMHYASSLIFETFLGQRG